MKIKYRYYSSSRCRKPPMSPALEALIVKCVTEAFPLAAEVEIVHLGTVGDKAHKARKSHHNHTPPDAIDIQQIRLNYHDGGGYAHTLDLRDNIVLRKAVADFIEERGGKCYHATDKRHGHLHVQTGDDE